MLLIVYLCKIFKYIFLQIDDLPLPIKEENEVKPLEIVNENSSSLKAYVKPQVIKKPKTSVVKPMIKKEEKVPVVANSYNNSAKDWSSVSLVYDFILILYELPHV